MPSTQPVIQDRAKAEGRVLRPERRPSRVPVLPDTRDPAASFLPVASVCILTRR